MRFRAACAAVPIKIVLCARAGGIVILRSLVSTLASPTICSNVRDFSPVGFLPLKLPDAFQWHQIYMPIHKGDID